MDHWFGAAKAYALIPIGGFLLYVFMYLLLTTADDYLSPTLEFLTNKLKISESVAGVTLLALGNGAPDVFAAISAKKSTVLRISNLVGSTIFISTICQVATVRAA